MSSLIMINLSFSHLLILTIVCLITSLLDFVIYSYTLNGCEKVLGERRIKYFACGEYGNNTHRPHYHAIIYGVGLDRDDKRIMRECWNYCD